MIAKTKQSYYFIKLKEDYILAIKSGSFNASLFIKKYNKLQFEISNIISAHDVILFILNHPGDVKLRDWAWKVLMKISSWCKKNAGKFEDQLDNSGLPYSHIYSLFSFTISNWMLSQKFNISLNAYQEESDSLNEVFQYTLSPLQRELTQLDFSNSEWFEYFNVKENDHLAFLIKEFSQLNPLPVVRDILFDKQHFTIHVFLQNENISKTYNRLNFESIYYHGNWIKNIETSLWIKNPIPNEINLSEQQRLDILFSSKLKLILLQRETDPVTYMDANTIRYFQMERGISIALFTMTRDRQLPFESYVGYTLYKNGYPAAYGGAWIFGYHALIGLNIFDWCRGGESALFFNNLLRVYHQLFDIQEFEVEPYQYGKDNPEGILSGAFWFYYKMGFAPLDKKLNGLAKTEFKKMKENKKYRTKSEILKKFTESNISVRFNNKKNLSIAQLKKKIDTFNKKHYKQNYYLAEHIVRKQIIDFIGPSICNLPLEVITEIGFLSNTLNWINPDNKNKIEKLIRSRLNNPYEYQKLIRDFLTSQE